MTDRINDGGPAFPITASYGTAWEHNGMTMRDWFAASVIASANDINPHLPGDPAGAWPAPEELAARRAKWAYLQADAMLEARK